MPYNAVTLVKSNAAFIFDNPHIVIKMSFAREIPANLGYFIVGFTRFPSGLKDYG